MAIATATTYSFRDVQATISGGGGGISLGGGINVGNDSGAAEEGITVEPQEDKDTMTWGADGSLMHSLHAAIPFRVTVRLLKTSPTNARLAVMFNAQQGSAASWGGNSIHINDMARGDKFHGVAMAFMRFPTMTYAKEGGINEWVFGGAGDWTLGDGNPTVIQLTAV